LAEIRVAPGAAVQPGAWVATLAPLQPLSDPDRLRYHLQETETALADARRDYLQARQQVETGAGSAEQLAAAIKNFDAARAARDESLAELETAQQAAEDLRHYAPCVGTVADLPVAVGTPVAPGAPILFIQPRP
jgi:multidrug efflux pump subunit AcrA (membrane-fusion protein)